MTGKQSPQQEPPAVDQAAELAVSPGAAISDEPGAIRTPPDTAFAPARRRAPARGTPAPLEQRDVEALIRGEISPALADKVASQPLERVERPESAAAATFSPVRLDAKDLSHLEAKGRASPKFEQSLERTSLMRDKSVQLRPADGSEKSAPKQAPDAGETTAAP